MTGPTSGTRAFEHRFQNPQLDQLVHDALNTKGVIDTETAGQIIEASVTSAGLSAADLAGLSSILHFPDRLEGEASRVLGALLGPQPALESSALGWSSFTPMGLRMETLSPMPEPTQAQLALAARWIAHSGETKTPAALLNRRDPLSNALKLFANAGDKAIEQVQWHLLVNSDAPLTTRSGGSNPKARALSRLQQYAQGLGFKALKLDGEQLIAVRPSGENAKLGKVSQRQVLSEDGWIRSLGRMLNTFALGPEKVIPAHPELNTSARGFDAGNAQLSAHLASLAYRSEDVVRAHLDAMGYDLSTFSWIEDKNTDTQGFVVADPKGRMITSFRGTESLQDWKGNFRALMTRPDWAPPGSDIKVHAGFNAAVEAVWPQLLEAFQKADGQALFSGHSLGGALAQLALTRAVSEGHLEAGTAQLYTIGQPRVGNQALVDATALAAPRTFRLVNKRDHLMLSLDPVTGVPPKFLGYRHAGTMVETTPSELKVLSRGRAFAEIALESVAGLESVGMSQRAESIMDPSHADLESPAGYEAWLSGASARSAEPALEGAFISGALGVHLHDRGEYINRVVNELMRNL